MSDVRWDHLPCGRDKERLLQFVADGIPLSPRSHEANCPYCQAAFNELSMLWAPVSQWATRSVPVPADLLRTVIARVRRMTQSPHHVVASTARGLTSVTSWVIGILSSEAALRIPGVTGVGGKTSEKGGHVSDVRNGADAVGVTEVGTAAVSVDFSIEVRPSATHTESNPSAVDDDLLALSDRVRASVIGQLRQSAAIEVSDIDVTVDDIILE